MTKHVVKDGEEIRVSESVRVQQEHLIHARGGHETFTGAILHEDSLEDEVEAVTLPVAEHLWHEFGVEVNDHEIEVIDTTDNDVEVI